MDIKIFKKLNKNISVFKDDGRNIWVTGKVKRILMNRVESRGNSPTPKARTPIRI